MKVFTTFFAISLWLSGCAHHSTQTNYDDAKAAVTELFVATDQKDWPTVERLFADEVHFDMTSVAGGQPQKLSGKQIAEMWSKGLAAIDHVHHQAGNYIVKPTPTGVEVYCYATASHFIEKSQKLTHFVGSYNFDLVRSDGRWVISSFKFNKKYVKELR